MNFEDELIDAFDRVVHQDHPTLAGRTVQKAQPSGNWRPCPNSFGLPLFLPTSDIVLPALMN
jgi:hypothetical protein